MSPPAAQMRLFDASLADTDPIQKRVFKTYTDMHTYQTVDFVRQQHKHWLKFDKAEWTIMEALEHLNTLIDESDPDVDFSNDNHAYQTAEAMRAKHPDKPWFQLTGLIHDIGKVNTLWGQPQWASVGDTFVVGCKPAPSVVFVNETFGNNPDMKDPRYNTELGMYKANCGFDNVLMSFGHDEYLYQVLKNHSKCRLPAEALYMIRYHSFYPWHTGGDYAHLASEYDKKMLSKIHLFNEFDLYSKVDNLPDIDELKPYYQKLIDDWCPGAIKF
jgi:inositol oxygenase